MRHLQGFLLGSAAALCAAANAQAADLPAAKSAPVEYVRVCTTHGEGFFYVPGTDSCLRISGRVRADYLYAEPVNRFQDITGFRARGRINLDSRTATSYGLLRAYVRYEIDRNSGAFASPGQISTNAKINQAYVQFGGLTAGRVTSFFSDSTLPAPNFGDLRFDDPTNADVTLLAYTYSFGNGFSGTLSLEDAIESRVSNPLAFPLFGTGAASPVFAPLPFDYGGERMPDVVANLRYKGAWGSVQLSGALHQIRDVAAGVATVNGNPVPVINPITGLPNPTFADTDYGFASGPERAAPSRSWAKTMRSGCLQRTRMVLLVTSMLAKPGPSIMARLAPVRSHYRSRMRLSIPSRGNSKPTKPTESLVA